MTDWSRARQADAIAWYAATYGVRVFTDVPVTRADWANWPNGTNERLETIAIGFPGSSSGEVRRFDEEAFRDAIATRQPVRPLIARGYADRTVFGWLITRRAFTAQSWQPTGAVLPLALVAQGSEDSNVAPAYTANGFEIIPVGGGDALSGGHSGGGSPSKGRNPWDAPQPGEDELLHELWERRGRAGWWLAEVPVGFHTGSSPSTSRRFDAVVVESAQPRHSAAGADLEQFKRSVASGAAVEIIEAKSNLTADAIGQLLSGAHLFSQSWPKHGMLTYTLCVHHQNEFALRWFCARQGVRIEQVRPPLREVDEVPLPSEPVRP